MSLSSIDLPAEASARRGVPWARWRTSRRDHVVFVRRGRAWGWTPGASKPATVDDVSAWCADHPRTDLRLVLSGDVTHTLHAHDPALPLANERDLLAYARHQFVHYHGGAAQHWPISTWSAAGSRGAVALHGLDLAAVVAAAVSHRVRLRSIEPYWSIALRHVSKHDALLDQGDDGFDLELGLAAEATRDCSALAVVEGAAVTVLSICEGRVRRFRQRRLDAATPAALEELIAELRVEEDLPRRVRVIGFGLSPGALQSVAVWAPGSLVGDHPPREGLTP